MHFGKTVAAAILLAVGAGSAMDATAATMDLEDVQAFSSLPITSQGLRLTSTGGPNAIFNAPATGAQNTTGNFLAWCGSGCGGLQTVTASLPGGGAFSVTSIDAGNLDAAGSLLGFAPGMTLELVGNLLGGGTVTQSLTIVEDTVTTFSLTGFTSLVSLQMSSPAVGGGNPDPLIDNIVFTTADAQVPLPAGFWLMLTGIAAIGAARTRLGA